MSSATSFNDVHELLAVTELVDIVTYRFAAELSEVDTGQPLVLKVLTRCADGKLEVRMDASLDDSHGNYALSNSAIFSLPPETDVPQALVQQFAEKVGVLAVYPYIREGVCQLAARLGQPMPVLPLLRAGELKLSSDDGRAPDSEACG